MVTFKKKWNYKVIQDDGSVMSQEAINFLNDFNEMLDRELSSNGINIVKFSPNHYDFSGFLEKDGKYIYISYSIPRQYKIDFNSSNAMLGVLYRTAKSDSDYHGGYNNYSSIQNLPISILEMFTNYDRYSR